MSNHDPAFGTAQIDGTANKHLAKNFKIKGFPSFFMVSNGKLHPYAGREPQTLSTLSELLDDLEAANKRGTANLVKFAEVSVSPFANAAPRLIYFLSFRAGFQT
jgi:hypothetical protein